MSVAELLERASGTLPIRPELLTAWVTGVPSVPMTGLPLASLTGTEALEGDEVPAAIGVWPKRSKVSVVVVTVARAAAILAAWMSLMLIPAKMLQEKCFPIVPMSWFTESSMPVLRLPCWFWFTPGMTAE